MPGLDEWDHVQKLSRVMAGVWKVKCLVCQKEFQGGADRVRSHFGAGTGPASKCVKLAEEKNEWCAALQAAVSDCAAIQVAKDAEAARKRQAAAIAAAQQAARQVADAQAAKQQTMERYKDAEGNMKPRKPRDNAVVDDAWMKCFAANAIPLHIIEVGMLFVACTVYCCFAWLTQCFVRTQSPSFADAVEATQGAVGKYEPVKRITFSSTVLDRVEAAEAESARTIFVSGIAKTGVTVVSDGWTGVDKRPLINVVAISAVAVLLLDVIDTSGETKARPLFFWQSALQQGFV
jgi:hypothetical protein